MCIDSGCGETSIRSASATCSQSRHVRDFLIDSSAGAVSGVACVYSGQPLDTIKVKMQAFPGYYKGGFDCFKHVLRSEGFYGLYKGSVPAIACNVAENAVLFMSLGFAKKTIGALCDTDCAKLSTFQVACAGGISAVISSLVVCPAELIKCRVQGMAEMVADGKASRSMGPSAVVQDLIRNRGMVGLMTGVTSTWAREIPGYFSGFFGYDFTRTLLTPEGKSKDDIGPLGLMFAGGTAGLCFWCSVYPLDSIKSRVQVLSLSGQQAGFFTTFWKIVCTEGFCKLYSGILPCIVRSYPANGALFLAYESTKKLLEGF